MVRRKVHELKLPYWIVDGINGILALVLYNFILFIFKATEIGGIFGEIEEIMGYFGANFFIMLGFSRTAIMLGVISVFLLAFVLGMSIALFIRIMRKEKLAP